ncbi:MAG: M20/M25/M40 family metallo-hydrolase [bacterium]
MNYPEPARHIENIKKVKTTLGLLLFTFLLQCISSSMVHPQSTITPTELIIRRTLASLESQRIRSTIQSLQNFQTRYLHASNRDSVVQWIRQQFLSMGYTTTSVDSFIYTSGSTISWQKNILATLPGTETAAGRIVVGGHYDSRANPDPMTYSPGADDNASGIAAILEIARVFKEKKIRPQIPITFIAFGAEEVGLYGSAHHARTSKEQNDSIRFMVNLDVISWCQLPPNQFLVKISKSKSMQTSTLSQEAVDATHRFTSLQASISAGISSDELSYQAVQIPALSFYESVFNPLMHTKSDVLENCNIEYCTEIARATAAFILSSAPPMTDDPALTVRPDEIQLYQNYPNPFNSSTTIEFDIAAPSHARIKIFNLLGKEVATLVDKEIPQGRYVVSWKAQDQSTGVYYCVLNSGGATMTKRILLLR